jgi:hypothetical protein
MARQYSRIAAWSDNAIICTPDKFTLEAEWICGLERPSISRARLFARRLMLLLGRRR